MDKCPFCGSEDIYYSKKRKIYVCEDCDETFSEMQSVELDDKSSASKGLELFFSYGHDRNRLLVERIKRDLEKRGHHVWIDTNEIKAGDYWRDDILNGILHASSVIAFLSEHSTRNPGVCLDELRIAVCVKGADIKTVLLEPESKIQPPSTISDIQWLDMSEWYDIRQSSETAFELWYREKLAELCRVVESSESVEMSGDISILKTKLTPYLNSEKEYNLLSKEFHGRRWLEEYIEEWQDKRSTKALVIYGRPGSGKSAFSVNYSHYNADVFGCFLCEWNRDYTINPQRLIRTMAFRLATKMPDYRSLLLRQLDTDVVLEKMTAETLFDYLLTYPLTNLVDGHRGKAIIVVDGLDEAESDGENPLAEVFSKCVERLPRWIRFIFTSRPEKSVKKYFLSSESIDLVKDMPSGYNDIMTFCVKTLAEELKQVPNKLEILNKLCELSDGVFLYAEMLVNDVKNGYINLSNIAVFPKGLNSFYRLSMERKFPTKESFQKVRGILELLAISENIPEELVRGLLGFTQYSFITYLDILGSWVNRYEENGVFLLGFSHKSLKDWFTNSAQSGNYFVDYKSGAIKLARYCRNLIENNSSEKMSKLALLRNYIMTHIGIFYINSEYYEELEEFLCAHSAEPDPYWRVWNQLPSSWDHTRLLTAFWESDERNAFLYKLQREGNVTFLRWVLNMAENRYGIGDFDKELVSVYMDIVHMSGEYEKAVSIAENYLANHSDEIEHNEFYAMLNVRRIHHSMFFIPVNRLLDEAQNLYSRIDERFPKVYNELLFLIGGNLGVLYGDWAVCKEWLDRSAAFTERSGLADFVKRNARKMADYYCHEGNYEKAESLLKKSISEDGQITGRYEAYLVGALANLYTCMSDDDEAMSCYEQLLSYTAAKGIVGWKAHAYLGIANINFKLGNVKEAEDFLTRAKAIYETIHQEWGVIMCEALQGACTSRISDTDIRESCRQAVRHADKMQYGSCIESIEELCSGKRNYLALYFL